MLVGYKGGNQVKRKKRKNVHIQKLNHHSEILTLTIDKYKKLTLGRASLSQVNNSKKWMAKYLNSSQTMPKEWVDNYKYKRISSTRQKVELKLNKS